MKIKGITALVTGANRGLGRAFVEELLKGGAKRVYAGARKPQQLDGLRRLDPDRVVPIELDVTLAEHSERAAREAADVELLINNAGTLASGAVLASSSDSLQVDLATNLFGPLFLARAFTPVLEQKKGSAVVNVLSVVSLASMPALGGYAASKAAAHSLTQSLRGELAQRGIHVHAVYPGPIDTDMIRDFEMPKTSPTDVVRAVLAGIESNTPDIFPDPMSREVGELWRRDPRAVESRFGAM